MRLRNVASRLFPHNNSLCVAPPGIPNRSDGRPIIIASLKRSGTHILIDLVLNNFPETQNRPLYIDFDEYDKSGRGFEEVLKAGSYIVKTHYPQTELSEAGVAALETLARYAHVIVPKRNLDSVVASLEGFSSDKTQQNIAHGEVELEERRHEKFWNTYSPLEIRFARLIDNAQTELVLQSIADRINLQRTIRAFHTPKKDQALKVLSYKLLTRLLGRHSPRINTTIQFATTSRNTEDSD